MGGWNGGQGQYVLTPYADWNLLVLDKSVLRQEGKLLQCTLLSDILPTGMDGCVCAGVGLGSNVLIAGAGPVGLCAVVSALLLGAAEVIVIDHNEERLMLAKGLGAKTININQSGAKADILHDGKWMMAEVRKLIGEKADLECAVDCVGYEATDLGQGADGKNNPEVVLNTCISLLRTGGSIGFPGVYMPIDPSGPDSQHKKGFIPLRVGDAFCKGLTLQGRQCPVQNYNKKLYKLILSNRMPDLIKGLNMKIIGLDQVPEAYTKFNKGEPCKYIVDPNGYLSNLSLLEKDIEKLTGGREMKDKMQAMHPSG